MAGAIIITGSILYSEWTYFLVFFFICLFSLREFYKLVWIDGMIPLKFWGTLTGLSLFTITFLVEKQILTYDYYYLIFPVSSMIFFIKLYKKTEKKPFTNIAFTFLGIIYVAVPFSLINFIVFRNYTYNFEILIGLLLLIWATDTGAYFAGTRFGKTKLFYRISPKKSWEGFVGGCILALLIAFLIHFYFKELLLWEWVTIGIIIIVTGTYGDLVESLFKRSIEIKDSSHSIPGHGGFLDRFDALFLSMPFIVAFIKIFKC